MPTISIAIPSKNRPAEVATALASIRQFSSAYAEIIVVDQSATPYALDPDPRLVHIYDPQLRGLTAARNRAADVAKSELILYVDDDVTFESDVVASVVSMFASDPAIVGAGPVIAGETDATSITQRIFHRGFFASHVFRHAGAADVPRLSGCAMAFRRALVRDERFDETLQGYCFGEDWDFSKRALRHGRLVDMPDAIVRHRPSTTNRYDRKAIFETRWRNMHYFYRKFRRELPLQDRLWYRWWEIGEILQWLRYGFGLPPRTT